MRKEAVGIGETVEAARAAACRELGVESDEAKFEIIEMPVKKTLGIFGGSPAKVKAYIEDSPADRAAAYLSNILNNLGLSDAKVDVQENESGALLAVTGSNVGFIIGHRGETLDALQYLTGLVANHTENTYYRITLDIGNYREKRRETLESLGKKLASKAVKFGRNNSLEPMNPYERRIIHTAVQEVEGATSWSEGKDQARHVVIGPEGGERYQPRRQSGRRPYSENSSYRRNRFNSGDRSYHRQNYANGRTYSNNRQHSAAAPLHEDHMNGRQIENKE